MSDPLVEEDIEFGTSSSQLESQNLQDTEDLIDDAFEMTEVDMAGATPFSQYTIDNNEELDTGASEMVDDDNSVELILTGMQEDGEVDVDSDKATAEVDGEPAESYVPQTVRRALSAWIIYCNDNRSRVKEANPSFGIKEMSQALSEEFRALTEEEKKVYEDKAALDKERYVREIQEQKRLMALHGSRVAPSMDIQKEYSLSKELIIPLGRLRRTMKMDRDVKNTSKTCLMAVGKATELFIAYLSVRTAQIAMRGKRRTVRVPDLLEAIHSSGTLAFLREDFPAPPPRQKAIKTAAETISSKSAVATATGKASITSFFSGSADKSNGNIEVTSNISDGDMAIVQGDETESPLRERGSDDMVEERTSTS